MRSLFAVVIAVAASAQAPAAGRLAFQQAQREAEPGRSVGTAAGVVHIDVIAADAAGRAVDNLKAADFDLREDGTPQSIDDVRFVKIDGGAYGDEPPPIRSELDERTEAARADSRLVAIFLDDYHVGAGAATGRVREALTRFVDRDLGPRDLVIVMKPLDSLLTIRLTRDRDQVHRAIDAFDGRKGAYDPRTAFEQNYIANTPARIEAARAQVTISALNALAIHLGSLSNARKTIVLVSEGFPREEPRRGFERLPTLESVVRAANRSNVSIYAVDPQNIPPGDSGAGAVADNPQETLRTLANETDGEAIVNANDLNGRMRRIADDSSAYYLIAYHSARTEDGKFHDIEVRVKRPDVRVRARKGYWASTPGERLRANLLARARDPVPALPLEPARRISPLIRPWVGFARGAGGRTRVTFVWEPVDRVPGDRARPSASRIVLTALGADNTALFKGPLLPAGPTGPIGPIGSVGNDPSEEASARAVFDVPPGRLRLRMSIEDAAERVIDSDVREIAIRDLRAPVALGTPEVLRARTARDVRALVADPDAVPVASREFSRAERLIIRFPAYAPGAERPAVAARLLSRSGKAMRDLQVQPVAPGDENQIDLPLASLAAGEYQLEITAKSPAGEARDLISFRVTS
jgi:VWFA-related protein